MVVKKSGKVDKFQPSGDVSRVQALGLGWKDPSFGRWVRIGNLNGKWRQFSVEQEYDKICLLLTIIADESPEFAKRIADELTALSPDTFPVDFHLADAVSQVSDTLA